MKLIELIDKKKRLNGSNPTELAWFTNIAPFSCSFTTPVCMTTVTLCEINVQV